MWCVGVARDLRDPICSGATVILLRRRCRSSLGDAVSTIRTLPTHEESSRLGRARSIKSRSLRRSHSNEHYNLRTLYYGLIRLKINKTILICNQAVPRTYTNQIKRAGHPYCFFKSSPGDENLVGVPCSCMLPNSRCCRRRRSTCHHRSRADPGSKRVARRSRGPSSGSGC